MSDADYTLDAATLAALTPEERAELDRLLAGDARPWRPQVGPQALAFASDADVLGFGGGGGGGKSDLALGIALSRHQRVGIFRQNGTELQGIIDRLSDLFGGRDGWNGSDRIWRTRRHDGVPLQIELGSFPNPGDAEKYRGRPHDFLAFDEAQGMREQDVRFLLAWLRTTDPRQRCQALLTFNPPSDVGGRWLARFFAPWLDPKHPNPAKPGELRWFAMVDGKDVERQDGQPFVHNGETIRPLSRTFIPARVTDNAYLRDTNYVAQLQSLPEPLRSQLLFGDFSAGTEDDPFQVIPTAWVEAAMARWSRPAKLPPMDSMGVDIAKGGRDNTILARRHGMWFDVPLVYPGKDTPDGHATAALCIAAARDNVVFHLDVFGAGTEAYGVLERSRQRVLGVNVGDKAPAYATDAGGRLGFFNLRSMLIWRVREALNPAANTGICLPPDQRLLADLCAYTWKPQGNTIKVLSTDEIKALIGRSPDWGSAYALALMDTPALRRQFDRQREEPEYHPMRAFEQEWRPWRT